MREKGIEDIFKDRLVFLKSKELDITAEIDQLEEDLVILEERRESYRIRIEDLECVKMDCLASMSGNASIKPNVKIPDDDFPYLVNYPELESRLQAHMVLENLKTIIEKRGVASVADYYKATGNTIYINSDLEWGWEWSDLLIGYARVEESLGKYKVWMPAPKKILHTNKDIQQPIEFTKYVMRSYDDAKRILFDIIKPIVSKYGLLGLNDYYETFGDIPTLNSFAYGWTADELSGLCVSRKTSLNHSWIFDEDADFAKQDSQYTSGSIRENQHLLHTVWTIEFPECKKLV